MAVLIGANKHFICISSVNRYREKELIQNGFNKAPVLMINEGGCKYKFRNSESQKYRFISIQKVSQQATPRFVLNSSLFESHF